MAHHSAACHSAHSAAGHHHFAAGHHHSAAGHHHHHHSNGCQNTATSYHFVAPPPQNQSTCLPVSRNSYYSDPDDASQPRDDSFYLFFGVLMVSIFIFICIMMLTHIPQTPQFRVETLTLTNFNVSSNTLISSNWDVRFNVRNPNSKVTVSYDEIEASIFYKSDSIADTTVPPFVQGSKNETVVRATFASLTAYMDDRDSINGERNLNFSVRMSAMVEFNTGGGWGDSRGFLCVYCPNLSIGVSANNSNVGSLVGGSKECTVKY